MLGRLLEQASAGQLPDSGVTIAELLARYMEVAELDVSTRDTYEGYIRRTILPALGSMELRKLRGPVLDMFYARLRRCGNLARTGRPFTEHRYLPALAVVHGSACWVAESSPSPVIQLVRTAGRPAPARTESGGCEGNGAD